MSGTAKCFSRVAYLYLLVTLVVPALIPTGYMIGTNSASNLVEITICSAINHRQVFLDLNTGKILGDSDDHVQRFNVSPDVTQQIPDELNGDPCPFWLASAAALINNSVNASNLHTAPRITTVSLVSRLLISHPTPPLPARGPPKLV
jgi:hypothetical protein